MRALSFSGRTASPDKLTMRDLYASHAAAVRDALRHAVERGGMSSLGVLHQGVPSPSTGSAPPGKTWPGCKPT